MKADKRKSVLRHPDLPKFSLNQPCPDLSDPWPSSFPFESVLSLAGILAYSLHPDTWASGSWLMSALQAQPPHLTLTT